MLYQHQYPPDAEAAIVQECHRTKEAIPAPIANKPELFLGLALYFNAWFDLDIERDRSKLEPITRAVTFQYAYDYDFDEEQAEDLWYYIARMDKDFLAWYKTKLPKPKQPRGPRTRR